MTTYFGFAISNSMFPENCTISKQTYFDEYEIEHAVNVCKKDHIPTIEAANSRFNLAIEVPETPPMVSLQSQDDIIVMDVWGLPQLIDGRAEYTHDEIANATFVFSRYFVN